MHDEPLQPAVVFQHLDWSWSFYGLQLFHFAIAAGSSVLILFGGIFLGFNALYSVAFFVAFSAGLGVIQWRKPANYIPDLIMYLFLPRHLSCLEDDVDTSPFGVAREDLDP